MDTSILNDKIATLPIELQRQVSDYVDFLMDKYEVISEAHQKVLDKRLQDLEDNPDNFISAKDVSNQLKEKYGWK